MKGVPHFTKDAPGNLTSYSIVTVPDGISWRHPPPMSGEISTDKKLSSQEIFKQVSRSVLWVESEGRDFAARSAKYGSAVAISEDLVLTNCHVVGTGTGSLRVGDEKQDVSEDVELEAADFDCGLTYSHRIGVEG
jgi:S1-C subfamily serine protease